MTWLDIQIDNLEAIRFGQYSQMSDGNCNLTAIRNRNSIEIYNPEGKNYDFLDSIDYIANYVLYP